MNRQLSYSSHVDDLLTDLVAACVSKVMHHPGCFVTAKVLSGSGVAHAFASNELVGAAQDIRSVAVLWTRDEWALVSKALEGMQP